MAPPTPLLGPPELAQGLAYVDINDAQPAATLDRDPPKVLVNGTPTFNSSGHPCLDFFFQVVPDSPADIVTGLLERAWNKDPLTALKLVCHLRAVRGTGKADQEGFYTASLWLHKHHPKTLALNARCFAEVGYLKDLPEILYRLVNGADARKNVKEEAATGMPGGKRKLSSSQASFPAKKNQAMATKAGSRAASFLKKKNKKKKTEMASKAVKLYCSDRDFQFLHNRVSDLFADLLRVDLGHLRAGDVQKIGLAAKWCPSLDSSYDMSTLLCESIARRLFPRDSDPEYRSLDERHYVYRVRDRLRKEALVPLRKALSLPEVYMSSNEWELLSYDQVASASMRTHKDLFMKHDGKRFAEYQDRVAEGKATIAAGALLPHEIVASACGGEEEDKVAELQWRRMVEDISSKGKFTNCMAVCGVSASMEGTPLQVCLALGLLVAEMSEEPWNGALITFSDDPQLHRIEGKTLRERAQSVKGLECGSRADFQKVFERILSAAEDGNLAPEKMIRRVFVFSDMEFSSASCNGWETAYEAICRKFEAVGYGAVVPEVVFWNLTPSSPTPVLAKQKGVALVSGFSKNLVKLFLGSGGRLSNPEDVMKAALSGDEYENLVLLD